MNRKREAEAILGNLVCAVNMLQSCPEFALLVPEVRVNLAYALPDAKIPQEVAAVEGRITVVRGLPHASGMPAWGASDHLARRILEVRTYDPEINAAINFKCDQGVIESAQEYCSERGLLLGWLDRSDEPADISEPDGASMPWKVKRLVAKYGRVPRLFYEGPGWGKEPLFLAVGRDAVDVASVAMEIAHLYSKRKQQ
ncbi:MAG: phosphomethylpyrimidine kinase [Chloroflexi bacterium]|nr:phosphomethylpyrimidine kinase [Chloroflexota bacterium]